MMMFQFFPRQNRHHSFSINKRRQVHQFSPAQSTKWKEGGTLNNTEKKNSNRRGPNIKMPSVNVKRCAAIRYTRTPFLLLFAHPLTTTWKVIIFGAPGGHPCQLYSQSINKKNLLRKTPNYDTIPHGVLNRPINWEGKHTHTQNQISPHSIW